MPKENKQENWEKRLLKLVVDKCWLDKANPQERWCPSCESESVPIHIVSKERAYTLCTRNEEAGRDYFDPFKEVFNTVPLIDFIRQLLAEQKKEIINNLKEKGLI